MVGHWCGTHTMGKRRLRPPPPSPVMEPPGLCHQPPRLQNPLMMEALHILKLHRGFQLRSRRSRRSRRGIGLGEAAASGDSTCIPALAPALTGEKDKETRQRQKRNWKRDQNKELNMHSTSGKSSDLHNTQLRQVLMMYWSQKSRAKGPQRNWRPLGSLNFPFSIFVPHDFLKLTYSFVFEWFWYNKMNFCEGGEIIVAAAEQCEERSQ